LPLDQHHVCHRDLRLLRRCRQPTGHPRLELLEERFPTGVGVAPFERTREGGKCRGTAESAPLRTESLGIMVFLVLLEEAVLSVEQIELFDLEVLESPGGCEARA